MTQNDTHRDESGIPEAVRSVEATCFRGDRADGKAETENVAAEWAVTLTVKEVGDYTLMCTPTDLKALAAGFAFSEGMISTLDDIHLLALCEDQPDVIRMEIRNPQQAAAEHTLIVVSSCGICGKRDIDKLLTNWPKCGDSLRVPRTVLNEMVTKMRAEQKMFATTGATHAAAVFATSGDIIGFGEDIGRHNALDKAIGQCLLTGRPMAGCSVALSGRVRFELVSKSVRAGFELLAGVSAPTSLAIDIADLDGITLCAFVRDDRTTAYTHPHRIIG